jgi:adenine deaminase
MPKLLCSTEPPLFFVTVMKIGNVCDQDGIEWMLEDARRAPLKTDDRDADDLFLFGMDWVVRQAVECGLPPTIAWSCGSLHPATRFGLDNDLGALGPSRRADIVLLNDDLQPQATWFGGKLAVEGRKPTEILERALENRYRYPDLLATVERHHKSGGVAFGLLKDFGLQDAAVASSVGHDAHNIVVAGTNEGDMRVALKFMKESQGGICIVRDGKICELEKLFFAQNR